MSLINELPDWTPPPCPQCGDLAMTHRFFCIGDKNNGWYCSFCGMGPYQLGTKQEAEKKVNTEALSAKFAMVVLNK